MNEQMLEWWKTWTPDMAYVLGFIYADGNVPNDRSGRVSIAQADTDILRKISDTIHGKVSAPIANKYTGIYYIHISVPGIKEVLAQYGIVTDKTRNGFWPPSIPFEMEPHFIRGYFDGDGYVGINPSRTSTRPVVTFACHKEQFLLKLADTLEVRGISKQKPHFNSRRKTNYILSYRRRADLILLHNIIYRNSPIHLDRKKAKFDEILELYKSRSSFGSKHHGAKLTTNDVKEIRKLYSQGNLTQAQIGELFGVNNGTVSGIVNRKSWKHVKDD